MPFPCVAPTLRAQPTNHAGILSAAVDHGFASHERFLEIGKSFAARCRANHNCAGTLSDEILRTSELLTPPDAAERLSGRGYIALSSPNVLGWPVGAYVVNFTSRAGAEG